MCQIKYAPSLILYCDCRILCGNVRNEMEPSSQSFSMADCEQKLRLCPQQQQVDEHRTPEPIPGRTVPGTATWQVSTGPGLLASVSLFWFCIISFHSTSPIFFFFFFSLREKVVVNFFLAFSCLARITDVSMQ